MENTIKACYALDEKHIPLLINHLMKKEEVFAPHKKGEHSFSFQKVEDPRDVVLSYPRTIQPLKKFFLPPKEVLLNFNRSKNQIQKPEEKLSPRIFFGIHGYEMQGLLRLDYSFTTGNPESNYLRRRALATFVGVSYEPDEYHFSDYVGVDFDQTDGFSLYLKKLDQGFQLWVLDEKGESLISDFVAQLAPSEPQLNHKHRSKNRIKVHYNRLPQIFHHVYQSNVWQKVAERCVGCGTCNLLCPTCYCFDVRDEVELDIDSGKRQRFWDGCMLNHFAEVAGGEDFRDKLHLRTRHRLFRKFKYITEKSGTIFCVGCGRCTKYCPADISLVEIINSLVDDYNQKQMKPNYQS